MSRFMVMCECGLTMLICVVAFRREPFHFRIMNLLPVRIKSKTVQ